MRMGGTTSEQEVLRVGNAGNVGIGTNSTDAKLHVVGDIKASGNAGIGSLAVSGISTFNNVINANQGITLTEFDNKSILLGASDDMRIRHTGSHSEITDEGDGSLRLGGNNVVIGSATFGVTMATFAQGGAVNLYHNNLLRLTTDANGVQIKPNVGGVTQLGIAQTTTTAYSINGTISFINSSNTTAQIQGRTGSASTTGDILFLCNTAVSYTHLTLPTKA